MALCSGTVAPIRRNRGSQTPELWLNLIRNTHLVRTRREELKPTSEQPYSAHQGSQWGVDGKTCQKHQALLWIVVRLNKTEICYLMQCHSPDPRAHCTSSQVATYFAATCNHYGMLLDCAIAATNSTPAINKYFGIV